MVTGVVRRSSSVLPPAQPRNGGLGRRIIMGVDSTRVAPCPSLTTTPVCAPYTHSLTCPTHPSLTTTQHSLPQITHYHTPGVVRRQWPGKERPRGCCCRKGGHGKAATVGRRGARGVGARPPHATADVAAAAAGPRLCAPLPPVARLCGRRRRRRPARALAAGDRAHLRLPAGVVLPGSPRQRRRQGAPPPLPHGPPHSHCTILLTPLLHPFHALRAC